MVVALPCGWAWVVTGTFEALLMFQFFGDVVECWVRNVRVAVWVGSSWERSGWERSGWECSGWEVSSSTADVCSEGDGNMSGWWMWMVGDAGGSEEGEAYERDEVG